jgi:cytochrome P450
MRMPKALQTLSFGLRPQAFVINARERYGDTFQIRLPSVHGPFVVTSHPDHVKSLFTADPKLAHSLTGESPLRPILGPNSVLTSIGERHMRQRKLLLPPFHGEAIQRYAEMIGEVAEREIETWPIGEPFALAPRMQAVTLDVIMAAIFGVPDRPRPGTPEHGLREAVRRLTKLTTRPWWQLIELRNLRREEARGIMRRLLDGLDRHFYAVISARRAAPAADDASDVLSLLLAARDEDGEPLSDRELRDELVSLVLAGHETTANSLAWAFERLVRTPAAYDRLREVARGDDDDPEGYVEATIHEAMRVRPVIPIVVRLVKVPWQLGDFVVPAGTPVALSIVLVHHREDVYPDPFAFRPERFVGQKPGTYTWIPFGGGTRRCLGASLAMAEQRVVLKAIARRTDMAAAGDRPERARQRNVTTIPSGGGRVVVTARHPG